MYDLFINTSALSQKYTDTYISLHNSSSTYISSEINVEFFFFFSKYGLGKCSYSIGLCYISIIIYKYLIININTQRD